jgi:UDP-N-acetylglucosamine transferase subunit ALG13
MSRKIVTTVTRAGTSYEVVSSETGFESVASDGSLVVTHPGTGTRGFNESTVSSQA